MGWTPKVKIERSSVGVKKISLKNEDGDVEKIINGGEKA